MIDSWKTEGRSGTPKTSGLVSPNTMFGCTNKVVAIVALLCLGTVSHVATAGALDRLPAISPQDLAVFRAVIGDEQFSLAYGMRDNPVLLDRTYAPSEGHVYNGFVRMSPFLNFAVDPALLGALNTANRVAKSIPDGALPIRLVAAAAMERAVEGTGDVWTKWEGSIGGASRVVILSLPGYDATATSAVVAIQRGYAAPCCPEGYLAYLEFCGGTWEVCGYGGFWVA